MFVTSFLPHNLRRWLFAIRYKETYRQMKEMRKSNGEYSFKPFDGTKSIFVHIPKSAGVSVCKSLYGNLAGGHCSLARYRYVFSQTDFDNYFKFTFVRNPWDRLFSAYTFLQKGGFNQRDQQWVEENIAQFSSFEEFVSQWVTEENINKYIHFVPQTTLLLFPGQSKITIDFVGFFENIKDDFTYVASKVKPNASLTHLNQSNECKSASYLDNYSESMINIVKRVYRLDIDLLGYSFDNSSLEQQLVKRCKEGFL